MWRRGELPAHQLPSGTVIVEVPPTSHAVRPQTVAVSARVCSAQNWKHLDSQVERVSACCAAKGWQVTQVVKECGSGVNAQRPQLLALARPIRASVTVRWSRRTGAHAPGWPPFSPCSRPKAGKW